MKYYTDHRKIIKRYRLENTEVALRAFLKEHRLTYFSKQEGAGLVFYVLTETLPPVERTGDLFAEVAIARGEA